MVLSRADVMRAAAAVQAESEKRAMEAAKKANEKKSSPKAEAPKKSPKAKASPKASPKPKPSKKKQAAKEPEPDPVFPPTPATPSSYSDSSVDMSSRAAAQRRPIPSSSSSDVPPPPRNRSARALLSSSSDDDIPPPPRAPVAVSGKKVQQLTPEQLARLFNPRGMRALQQARGAVQESSSSDSESSLEMTAEAKPSPKPSPKGPNRSPAKSPGKKAVAKVPAATSPTSEPKPAPKRGRPPKAKAPVVAAEEPSVEVAPAASEAVGEKRKREDASGEKKKRGRRKEHPADPTVFGDLRSRKEVEAYLGQRLNTRKTRVHLRDHKKKHIVVVDENADAKKASSVKKTTKKAVPKKSDAPKLPRGRNGGRNVGSTNKPKDSTSIQPPAEITPTQPVRTGRRGRPVGSKSKGKNAVAEITFYLHGAPMTVPHGWLDVSGMFPDGWGLAFRAKNPENGRTTMCLCPQPIPDSTEPGREYDDDAALLPVDENPEDDSEPNYRMMFLPRPNADHVAIPPKMMEKLIKPLRYRLTKANITEFPFYGEVTVDPSAVPAASAAVNAESADITLAQVAAGTTSASSLLSSATPLPVRDVHTQFDRTAKSSPGSSSAVKKKRAARKEKK